MLLGKYNLKQKSLNSENLSTKVVEKESNVIIKQVKKRIFNMHHRPSGTKLQNTERNLTFLHSQTDRNNYIPVSQINSY